jgi:hypothetical protein
MDVKLSISGCCGIFVSSLHDRGPSKDEIT